MLVMEVREQEAMKLSVSPEKLKMRELLELLKKEIDFKKVLQSNQQEERLRTPLSN